MNRAKATMLDEGWLCGTDNKYYEGCPSNVGQHKKTDFDTKTQTFNKLLLSVCVCEAVWYITNCNYDGSLQPDDIEATTGCLVVETLCDKHPDLWQPNLDDSSCKLFEQNEECLDVIGLNITKHDVSEMAPWHPG